MSNRATIVTVAQEAGVSTSTVSQVLSGSGRISTKTREKVLEAARRVNYQRDNLAAALRSKQFKEIGLLIRQIANPFNAEVIAGVTSLLETRGYLVFVLDTWDDTNRQERYLDTLLGGARGGLLWVPTLGTDEAVISHVVAQNIPTVTFLRPLPGGHFDHVGIENSAGTREATESLISLGHRNIAFLGGIGEVNVRMERIAGYSSAMKDQSAGEPVIWPCEETKRGGAEGVAQLLSHRPDITAIVCNGDVVAMGATLGLARVGKSAGKDISIVGFDGTEEAELWTPALSTVTVDTFGLGETLAQTLLDRIAEPDSPKRLINVPVKLVLRESTRALDR